MRKLASIQIIESLSPIEGADKIEVATVLGWQCVVKKDEFKVGEKIIYCEVDSVMPDLPQYEFLRDRKFRIKTIKLKGQISQGLVLPLSDLYNITGKKKEYEIDTDVTELMGITKYLTPADIDEIKREKKELQKANKLKKFMMRYSWFRILWRKYIQGFKPGRSWPYWVSKTDEPRIQTIPHVLEQFADKEVTITEKIDYQSATFTGQLIDKLGILGKLLKQKKYQFVVCSRNLTTNDRNSLYWKIAIKYDIENILKKNPDLTIQGEQGDINVQKNKYGIKEPKFWVFNIINHKTGYFYNQDEIVKFCSENNLTPVPYLTKIKLSDFATTIPEIVEKAKGKSTLNDKVEREGIVVRYVKDGQKLLSFKVINPNFLLKYDE